MGLFTKICAIPAFLAGLALLVGGLVGLVMPLSLNLNISLPPPYLGIAAMILGWGVLRPITRIRPKVDVTADEAKKVAPIVANVGLYNWFLASGLVWSLLPTSLGLLPGDAVFPVQVFFLGCVIVAGVYGALTVSVNTLIIQTATASAALVLAWLARGS